MAVKSILDFGPNASSAREVYGEELLKMAEEGYEFAFAYSDNVATPLQQVN